MGERQIDREGEGDVEGERYRENGLIDRGREELKSQRREIDIPIHYFIPSLAIFQLTCSLTPEFHGLLIN